MTDFNHVNTHPDHVLISELASWGEQHPDLWVRQLALIAFHVSQVCPKGNNIEQYFKDLNDEILSLKSSLEWAEERADESDADAKRMKIERDAAIFDIRTSEQVFEIKSLKARIIEKAEIIDSISSTLHVTRGNFDALQKSYRELESKYNTWIAVAT